VSELIALAQSEALHPSRRNHAAMCAAECYSLGFGVEYNEENVAQSILRASELASSKAIFWYPRVCIGQDRSYSYILQ
jgi:hypothetical protein